MLIFDYKLSVIDMDSVDGKSGHNMSNAMVKTKEDKLRELGIDDDKHGLFSDFSVDVMYDKFKHIVSINNKQTDGLLYFLNEILVTVGLDCIKKIEDFKILRSTILEFDGEKFVEKYRTQLEDSKIHVNNDLNFLQRKANNSYGFTVLKNITKFFGYSIESKSTHKIVDGKREYTRYYQCVENN
jgi:hypothetical protein